MVDLSSTVDELLENPRDDGFGNAVSRRWLATPGSEHLDLGSFLAEGLDLSIVANRLLEMEVPLEDQLRGKDAWLFEPLQLALLTPKAASSDGVKRLVQEGRLKLFPERFFRVAPIKRIPSCRLADASPDSDPLMKVGISSESNKLLGRGVGVAVLDTGLDRDHPDFSASRVSGINFIVGDGRRPVDYDDDNGHGTQCTGLACGPLKPQKCYQQRYGVASEALIGAVKVLDCNKQAVGGSIAAGLSWALSQNFDIISMSFGNDDIDVNEECPFGGLVRSASEMDVLLVAATGNGSMRPESISPIEYPARCEGVLAVSSVNRYCEISHFANGRTKRSDPSVDLVAPGEEISSSFPLRLGTKTGCETDSGTSFSTAYVAGIAALYQEKFGIRGAMLMKKILESTKELGNQAFADVGHGLVLGP